MRNSLDIPRSALAAGAVALALARPAAAADISFDCARLEPRQSEELAARLRLALRPSAAPPGAILVACDETRAWVVWNGPPLELVHVKEDGSLIESVLDAIETRVMKGPLAPPTPAPAASATAPPPSGAPKPSPNEVPNLEREPRAAVLPSKPHEPIGGLGVGGTLELESDALSMTAGPRLDVALGLGAFWAGFEESARFGSTSEGDGAFLYDLELTIGAGAPFAPDYPLGVVIGSGVEWFNVDDTERTGVATLGLRAAASVDPIALSFGIDGRVRFSPPATDTAAGQVQLSRYAVLLTVSGVLRLEPLLRGAPE